MESLVSIALWVLGGLTSIIAWFVSGNIRQLATLQTELNDHKVKVAETYVSRATLQELLAASIGPIMEELRKIDRTQERLFEALSTKVDKP